ncbi:hypothetical protein GF373_02790 [bacterium]|nr:hypothetical protein [bacterium]
MEPKIPIDREKIRAFCQKWKIKEFYLLGSVLREDFGPSSDVDVLVKMHDYEGIGFHEWLEMINEIENIFGRHVDLVSTDGVRNPFIRQEIAHNLWNITPKKTHIPPLIEQLEHLLPQDIPDMEL